MRRNLVIKTALLRSMRVKVSRYVNLPYDIALE